MFSKNIILFVVQYWSLNIYCIYILQKTPLIFINFGNYWTAYYRVNRLLVNLYCWKFHAHLIRFFRLFVWFKRQNWKMFNFFWYFMLENTFIPNFDTFILLFFILYTRMVFMVAIKYKASVKYDVFSKLMYKNHQNILFNKLPKP